MNTIEKLKQIERVDALIRRKSTGTPKHLASRLGVSERQIYNVINDMKNMGAPIYFCQLRQSYCYDREVVFTFGFVSEENTLKKLIGGIGNVYAQTIDRLRLQTQTTLT